MKNPDVVHPGDVTRTTASVLHSKALGGLNRYWTSALVWGMNQEDGHHAEHSVLAETNLQLNRWAVYGRYEFVQKSSEELSNGDGNFEDVGDQLYNVNALSVGVNRQIAYFANTMIHAGAQVTVHAADRGLDFAYGKNPVSAQVYLRFLPGLLRMSGGPMNR